MKKIRFLFCIVILLILIVPVFAQGNREAVILFTHDLHSHFIPVATENGGESGGYARLAGELEKVKSANPDKAVITVDAGDFSMGSLFQTVFTTDGAELRILGDMGYDATTFGNHEFDFRQEGLSSMLEACVEAKKNGQKLPEIVQANYWPDPVDSANCTESDRLALKAYADYGVKEYTIIEKNGVRFAIFGLLGSDADGDSPLSGMVYEPIIDCAKRIVADIDANGGADFIICLSHSGTNSDPTAEGSEDYELAKAVDGIDVIISGHTHSTLDEPVRVNNTFIVSCGSYAKNLGVIKLTKDVLGNVLSVEYELIPITESSPESAGIEDKVNDYKNLVASSYLSHYEGMESFDNVILQADFNIDAAGKSQNDTAIGNLITESYLYAVSNSEEPFEVAMVPNGVIRGTLPAGDITVSDAFNVLSLGVGADSSAGYPLVSIYMTGKELKIGFEIDASISPMASLAQLYMSGVKWTWNPNGSMFGKLRECWIVNEDGSLSEIEDDRLYHVVTGQNCVQMLGKVNALSGGYLAVYPKDKEGNIINDGGTYDSCIIHNENGEELKEWYAFASYLQTFQDTDGDGIANLPENYKVPKGNKMAIN